MQEVSSVGKARRVSCWEADLKAYCAECGVRLILKRDEAGVWTPLRCVSHPWAKRMPCGFIKRQFERLRFVAGVLDDESKKRVA